MEFFKKRSEHAVFKMPGADEISKHKVEYREDPLTGKTSVIGEGLLKKAAIFFGETDQDLVRELSENSKGKCFFCPPAVYEATPKYPAELCPEGRMQGEHSLLFPNLFPLAELHTVLTWPDCHFLSPGEFTPELLADLFNLTGRFLVPVRQQLPEIRALSLNSNYMPPAGASVLHPHFQLLGTKQPAHHHREVIEKAAQWYHQNGSCYWNDLISAEKNARERWVNESNGWSWFTAWSPIGSNEVLGVHESAQTLFDLKGQDWKGLASGLHTVLKEYHRRQYSSFNVCLTGGCCDSLEGQRCVIRVISRQNVKPLYRNDEYFLQKLHGIELIVSPPEELAEDLRSQFNC